MRFVLLVALCAGLSALQVTAAAAAKKKTSDTNSTRAQCLKQVGAYYHPAERRWYYSATGRGSPQEQAFYACLDAHTMGKR
jgi:hypothetical protein